MSAATLVLTALATLAAGGAFALVGACQARRGVGADARLALRLYVLWWIGLAASAVATATGVLLTAFGTGSPAVVGALRIAAVYAVCVALWGLMYYLSWLLTGSRKLLRPLALLYAAYYGAASFALLATAPGGIDAGPWHVDLAFDATWGPHGLGALLLVEVPPLVAGLLFLTLAPYVEAERRRRVALVAGAILAWCASGLALRVGADVAAAGAAGLALLGVAAALAVRAHGAPCVRALP